MSVDSTRVPFKTFTNTTERICPENHGVMSNARTGRKEEELGRQLQRHSISWVAHMIGHESCRHLAGWLCGGTGCFPTIVIVVVVPVVTRMAACYAPGEVTEGETLCKVGCWFQPSIQLCCLLSFTPTVSRVRTGPVSASARRGTERAVEERPVHNPSKFLSRPCSPFLPTSTLLCLPSHTPQIDMRKD